MKAPPEIADRMTSELLACRAEAIDLYGQPSCALIFDNEVLFAGEAPALWYPDSQLPARFHVQLSFDAMWDRCRAEFQLPHEVAHSLWASGAAGPSTVLDDVIACGFQEHWLREHRGRPTGQADFGSHYWRAAKLYRYLQLHHGDAWVSALRTINPRIPSAAPSDITKALPHIEESFSARLCRTWSLAAIDPSDPVLASALA